MSDAWKTANCIFPGTIHISGLQILVGPGHYPMISKYGPSVSKAVGPSFLVVKVSHFNKTIHLIASLRTPQNRKYM